MPYAHVEPPATSAYSTTFSLNLSRGNARHIGILLYEGFSLLGAGLVAELFQTANEIGAPAGGNRRITYDVRFLSVEGGSVTCSAAVRVWTDSLDPRRPGGLDMLFIAGGEGARAAARDTRLLCWLRAACATTDSVRPIAEGRAVLVAAGVIDSALPPCRPHLPLMASNDDTEMRLESMKGALAVIRRDLGVDVARAVVERVLPAWTDQLLPRLADAGLTSPADKIRAAARWLQQNCEHDVSIADAAEVATMSERNFLRRFKLEMGATPSDFLLQARLETACGLLAETELPVDKVARRSGMGNGDRLAKIFRKRLSLSPTEFRQRHNATKAADEANAAKAGKTNKAYKAATDS